MNMPFDVNESECGSEADRWMDGDGNAKRGEAERRTKENKVQSLD